MRIYLESLGCRLNYAEMATLGRQLTGAGHELTDAATAADLCVLNSCAVTGEAARQSRQLARQLARANPAARLIVTGCYATLEGETVAQLPNVELVVGNERKDELLRLIQESGVGGQGSGVRGQESAKQQIPPDSEASGERSTSNTDYAATHYAPRTAHPRLRQNPGRLPQPLHVLHRDRGAGGRAQPDDRRDRGRGERAARRGLPGSRADRRASGRLRERSRRRICARWWARCWRKRRIPRLRLSSLEPFDLSPSFFDLWADSDGRLMPHLHLPAQSGSDAVLRRMARRNRVADFEALVAAARAAIPGLTVTTDLIAGFPGETEEDFSETLDFARRVGFAHIHAFPYSARQGTAAARFGGQVPEVERKRRVRALVELDAELGAAVRRTFVGEVRPVLWENRDAAPPAEIFRLMDFPQAATSTRMDTMFGQV